MLQREIKVGTSDCSEARSHVIEDLFLADDNSWGKSSNTTMAIIAHSYPYAALIQYITTFVEGTISLSAWNWVAQHYDISPALRRELSSLFELSTNDRSDVQS